MKKYIGIKHIEAEPMTMGEAYERGFLQAGKVPKGIEKDNAGYHVRYKDGYESWSPAEPFEEAYRVADTPLERMLIKGEELTIKVDKLRNFIGSDKFSGLDIDTRALLDDQLIVMTEYQNLLNIRYARMENGEAEFDSFSFSTAIHLLESGYSVRRKGWEKEYRINQCGDVLFMDCDLSLSDFWRPSYSDIFAKDWELFRSR